MTLLNLNTPLADSFISKRILPNIGVAHTTDEELCVLYRKYYSYNNGKLIRREDGKEMGHPNTHGYLFFHDKYHLNSNISSHMEMVARVIYMMEVGVIPEGYQIDHIDGVRDNNLISNLQLLITQHNIWKRELPNETSKFFGVHYDKSRDNYRAQVYLPDMPNGRRYKKLGSFKNERQAAEAYNAYVLAHDSNQRLNILD